ncbi:MAG: hypothetical protein ACMG6E_10355 [Candidatus Roizmanbacteria bacterium]
MTNEVQLPEVKVAMVNHDLRNVIDGWVFLAYHQMANPDIKGISFQQRLTFAPNTSCRIPRIFDVIQHINFIGGLTPVTLVSCGMKRVITSGEVLNLPHNGIIQEYYLHGVSRVEVQGIIYDHSIWRAECRKGKGSIDLLSQKFHY